VTKAARRSVAMLESPSLLRRAKGKGRLRVAGTFDGKVNQPGAPPDIRAPVGTISARAPQDEDEGRKSPAATRSEWRQKGTGRARRARPVTPKLAGRRQVSVD